MRKIVLVIGLLILAVGISQLVIGTWWLNRIGDIADARWFNVYGVFPLVIGILLLVAAASGAITLRKFVVFVGLITLASGVAIMLAPDKMRDLVYSLLLDRSMMQQKILLFAAGIARIIVGLGLLLSLRRPRAAVQAAEPDDSAPA